MIEEEDEDDDDGVGVVPLWKSIAFWTQGLPCLALGCILLHSNEISEHFQMYVSM